MTIVYAGIDLAKNVFAVHGVDEAGKPALVEGGGGHRGEERAAVLGGAAKRRGLQAAGLSAGSTIHRVNDERR